MSDDWDTVTKIGSKARGGASQRETVVRGKGALNAAARSGAIVATEKKFSTGNPANKTGVEGQRLTKVDRADDIVAPQKLDTKIAEAIKKRRAEEGFKMTQAQLAQKVNAQANDIKLLESGTAIKNQALLNKVARVLKISPKTGEPIVEKEKK
ncbi:MAG: Endothelial differentiation- factor 1 [Icmadophila ericetorum]|nr:Endothelial differentiation- factor 1 [Icmadophila ericetorum]